MTRRQSRRFLLIVAASLPVAACGGGGAQGIAFIPPPPATPPPTTPDPPYDPGPIFSSAETQQFAAVDASNFGDTLAIRYDAGTDIYEVSINGEAYQQLRPLDGSPNNVGQYYSFGSPDAHGYLGLAEADGYSYSRIGAFRQATPSIDGFTAFGIATPASGVPLSGNASFTGVLEGITDAGTAGINGTFELAFDFGAGSLTGSLHPILNWFAYADNGTQDLGTYAVKDPVFTRGSTVFSGHLDTSVAGSSTFSGQFTGPGAEEMIGKWTIPFVWSSDPAAGGDGQVHSASGVMIGKR